MRLAPNGKVSGPSDVQGRMAMPTRRGALAVLILAVGCLGATLPSVAQTPACEPDKVATKYPSLAGKTIKIGADPTSPPYVTRDPKDFNQLIGFDADLARAVFDCAGVKYAIDPTLQIAAEVKTS